MVKFKKFFLYFSIALLFLPFSVFAEQCDTSNAQKWIKCIIGNVTSLVLWPVFAGLVVIMFVIAGIKFLTAQGDQTKITEARKTLIWASVGVAVGILAYSAVYTIEGFLGIR